MKKRLLIYTIALMGVWLSTSAQVTKHQAAYVYNFTRYVEWPASYKTGNFVIGVIGKKEAITKELMAISKSKKAGAQAIEIIEFASADAITQCHILFLPNEEAEKLSAVNEKLSGKSTLLITEAKNIPSGAGINFKVIQQKLKFQLDKSSFSANGLKVSDKLAALATN